MHGWQHVQKRKEEVKYMDSKAQYDMKDNKSTKSDDLNEKRNKVPKRK